MAVLGSPKKTGNSSNLAERFIEKSKSAGAQTKTYFLQGMNYGGCHACMACKTSSDKCVIEDDLAEVLEEMHASDVIVLATPNYFGDVTGQFKLFLDRTFSLLTPEFQTGKKTSRLASGKHVVFIMTQGAPDEAFKSISEKYAKLKDFFNFESFNVIRGCDLMMPGDVKKHPELYEQIDNLTKQLLC